MYQGIAFAWADNLESGKYPQGKFALQSNGNFCCFGVLAEMAVDAGVIERKPWETYGNVTEFIYDGDRHGMTSAVKAWAGMLTNEGQLDGGNINLMGMNDNGESFVYIAEIIRERWAEL